MLNVNVTSHFSVCWYYWELTDDDAYMPCLCWHEYRLKCKVSKPFFKGVLSWLVGLNSSKTLSKYEWTRGLFGLLPYLNIFFLISLQNLNWFGVTGYIWSQWITISLRNYSGILNSIIPFKGLLRCDGIPMSAQGHWYSLKAGIFFLQKCCGGADPESLHDGPLAGWKPTWWPLRALQYFRKKKTPAFKGCWCHWDSHGDPTSWVLSFLKSVAQ